MIIAKGMTPATDEDTDVQQLSDRKQRSCTCMS
eukprot:jgi/Botrbrau1/2160/Bobra.101_2s0001.1